MTRRTVGLLGLLIGLTPAGIPVQAKRLPPKEVASVVLGSIKYKVPHFGALHGQAQNGGYVQAWDAKSKKLLWDRMIYRVVYEPNLEKDVQDVFIVELRVKDGRLFVKNERNQKFEMDLVLGQIRALTALGPDIELPSTTPVP